MMRADRPVKPHTVKYYEYNNMIINKNNNMANIFLLFKNIL